MGRPLKDLDPANYRESLARRLRDLRKKKFEMQEEFADALTRRGLQTSKATVSNWELAKRLPAYEDVPLIAAVLGVEIEDLYPRR